jgi:hypothetical protein
MWGFNIDENDCDIIFVNGVAVKPNDTFYNIIMPFLNEYEAGKLKKYVDNGGVFSEAIIAVFIESGL